MKPSQTKRKVIMVKLKLTNQTVKTIQQRIKMRKNTTKENCFLKNLSDDQYNAELYHRKSVANEIHRKTVLIQNAFRKTQYLHVQLFDYSFAIILGMALDEASSFKMNTDL